MQKNNESTNLFKDIDPNKTIVLGRTVESISHLTPINNIEAELFLSGKKMNAIKMYSKRNKEKDLAVVAWIFFQLSYTTNITKKIFNDLTI